MTNHRTICNRWHDLTFLLDTHDNVEIWRDDDGVYHVDVQFVQGQGATLEDAVTDTRRLLRGD